MRLRQATVLFLPCFWTWAHCCTYAPRDGLTQLAAKISLDGLERTDDTWPLRPQTPWDISTDYPYPRIVDYTVEEGTWLRLDVHPRSGDIVFDMVGDLYCISAAEYRRNALHSPLVSIARPILRGVPHDADPHFSPDGEKVAFRSDAGLGIENIWVMDWAGCEAMDLDSSRNPQLVEANANEQGDRQWLLAGRTESQERKRRRLLREGRLGALRVTNETYRWTTDPRFHPSGSTIIATKWYAHRGLPGAEGWAYDVPSSSTGQQRYIPAGSGTRILGRFDFPATKNLEEVSVGPEQFVWWGEDAVIYSKNVKDVELFEYSKDVHKGIYSIFAFNITSGETTTLVTPLPGGASRPELSRDRRTLAFVRRVLDKEALVLKDLITGTLHYAWYGLDYDLSAISATMGTYPSFAFSPDDNAVIIWAAGRIYQVPLAVNKLGERTRHPDLEPEPIPFRARIRKQLANTVRGASELDLVKHETAETMRIHAFKDLKIDRRGKKALFQGAGRTYIHSITNSTTEELATIHPTAPYLTPAFVPSAPELEETWVINTRWSDTEFSSFELVDTRCGVVYPLKDLPIGRYHAPALSTGAVSEGNRTLAFIKRPGDPLSGDLVATAKPGLYVAELTLPPTCQHEVHREAISLREVRFIPSNIALSSFFLMRFASERSQLSFQGSDNSQLVIRQETQVFAVDLRGPTDITGRPPHTMIAKGEMTDEITVSTAPSAGDGRPFVAFVDFAHVYVAPLPSLDEPPLWSKPGRATKDLMRVSVNGGHDLAWSGDGKTLFWFSGPVLHSLEVAKLAQCKDAANRDNLTFGISCTKLLFETTDIYAHFETDVARLRREAKVNQTASTSLLTEDAPDAQHKFEVASSSATTESDSDQDVLIVLNATVLTMKPQDSENLLREAAIVVRNGVFLYVGSVSELPAYSGAKIINAHGGYVIPGFIDTHAHWIGFAVRMPATSNEMAVSLAYGVTTVHNPSGHDVDSPLERGRIERGQMPGPRVFCTGNIIFGGDTPGGHFSISDMDEAYEALWRIKSEAGPVGISYKNYIIHARASRQRLLTAARDLDMSCVPEGGMNSDWDLTYIIDGMTTLEHAYPIPVVYNDILHLFAKSGSGYTPTHVINIGGVVGTQYIYAVEDLNRNEKLRRFMGHGLLESLSEAKSRPADTFALFNTSASATKMAHLGMKVLIGAHGEPPQGFNYHYEMWFTQQGGLTNYETLRAATHDAASTLGLEHAIGSIEVGKLADFLIYPPGVDLLHGDMRQTLKLVNVVRGGRVWDSETMEEIWPVRRQVVFPPYNP